MTHSDIYLENIINNLPHFIFWKDKNSHFLGCNQVFAAAAGFNSPADIINKTDYQMPWKDKAEEYIKTDKAIINSGLAQSSYEEEQPQRDGSIATMLVSKVPIFDSEKNVVGILGIYIDITERKKMEKILQIAKEKTEMAIQNEEELRHSVMILAGSIAHDLRTPLACVKMFSKILSDEFDANLTPKITDALRQLNVISDTMNQSIDLTLKSLKQVVTGIKSNDDLMTCHIWNCVANAIKNYPFKNDEHNLVHWNNKNSFSFLGNTVFFYRIMFNLLNNSLYQIHQKGKGEIYIESDATESNNLLRFKDTAGGVTEQTIAKIFSGFNTTKSEGNGVGLAFCQFAMRSINGDLSCNVVDNDCIEFVMIFPS
jgi:PAS domain S-box-containing protein